MSDSILLRFLGSGLIDVGGDDAKLGKLQATSGEIAAVLKKNPGKTPAFSLIAFDSEAPASDPVVIEAVEVLKKQWPTYVNTFAGVPIGVIRALLLDALVEAARDDDRVAVAFAACARNVLPFTETGNEQSIWADSVQEIEASVDRRAEQEWATPASISIAELKLDSPPPPVEISNNPAKVDREVLLQNINSAVNNGHNVMNQFPTWATRFSSLLTDALTATIDGVAEQNKVGPINLSAPIQQITSAVSAYAHAVLSAVSGATAGLQRRTNLIWWKQAMFSPSAQTSYRKLPKTISAALMALDLYLQIPMFSPASVSAFLEEAVRTLQESDGDTRSLRVLLQETSKSIPLAGLRQEAAALYLAPTGRCTISALLAHPDKLASLDDRGFRNLIGVAPETALTDAQWAAWIFRDLQAGRATKRNRKKEDK